jgi:hypothetical protein
MGETRSVYGFFLVTPDRKQSLGRAGRRGGSITSVGCEGGRWMELAHNRVLCGFRVLPSAT